VVRRIRSGGGSSGGSGGRGMRRRKSTDIQSTLLFTLNHPIYQELTCGSSSFGIRAMREVIHPHLNIQIITPEGVGVVSGLTRVEY